LIEDYAKLTLEKPDTYSAVGNAIVNSINSINLVSDINTFVTENKTNVTPPTDIEYVPFDAVEISPSTPTSSSPNTKPLPNSKSSKNIPTKQPGKYSPGGKDVDLTAKEWGLTSSDAILSKDEQKSKLNGQITELDKAISSETKSKEGLENLVRFYASDPVAQKKAEQQLNEVSSTLTKLIDFRSKVASELSNLGVSAPALNTHAPLTQSQEKVTKVKGLYDYEATNDTELAFKQDEILTITQQDDSGWWYATNKSGKQGFVPNNYVKII